MGREQIEQTVEINEYKKQKPKEISHTLKRIDILSVLQVWTLFTTIL